MTSNEIIARLNLVPHPEGGHYRQTWIAETAKAADAANTERPAGTAIFFLLSHGEQSHWHKVDATEIWHFYAGAPLILSISKTDQGPKQDHILGADIFAGQLPQLIVPERHWQAAATTGNWTLVGCTVSPAFQFQGFTLAEPDFDIP